MKIGFIIPLLLCLQAKAQLSTISFDTVLMGSRFVFTAIAADQQNAWDAINAGKNEVIRIESIISSWDENSETSTINNTAHKTPVKVSNELFQLINRSIKVSQLTDGYFDITFASVNRIWDFSKQYTSLPDSQVVQASVYFINYKGILINQEKQTVSLANDKIKIGFGAIGKGYAAEQAKRVMQNKGATAGVVNAGGDMITWGNKVNGENWKVGIADPQVKGKVKMWLTVSNMAVVTSGDYERFIMIKGERYGHIINPKTGWPVKGIKSVTVICSNAELSDALATAVFVMGVTNGLNLINQLEGIECLIIDDQNKMHYSNHLELNYFSYD